MHDINHAEAIGSLKEASRNAVKSIDTLFESNANRKKETADLRLAVQSIQQTVANTNKTANRGITLMEEMKKSVDDVVVVVKHIDARVSALERSKFDPVKIVRWLGTWRGTFFMCFVFLVTVGVFVPSSQAFILDMLGIATKAKLP